MKTAISIPDDLFAAAEELARRSGQSRSALYSRAVREYLARHSPEAVTDAVDRALEHVGEQAAGRDAGFALESGRRILRDSTW